MFSTIWLEIRRSPMRWWLPFLLLIDLAMLFGRSVEWIGIWPQASAAAQLPIFYFSMLLASGAAWSAGRGWRTQAHEQFLATPLSAWKRELAQLTATVVYGLLPLAIGAVVAAAVTVAGAGPGFLWPSYLMLGMILVVISSAVGHLAGRMFRGRIAGPLVAMVAVFVLVSLQPIPSLQLMVLSGPPQLQIEVIALLTRAAFATALVAAAITMEARLFTERSWRGGSWVFSQIGTSAAVLTVVAITASSAALAGPLRTYRPAPEHPLCSETAPRVCIWPEHRVLLPKVTAIAQRFGDLSNVVKVPDTFYEEGLRAPIGANSDFALVLGDWAAARGMASTVLDATLGAVECPPPSDEMRDKNTTAWIELKEWLVARAYGPKPEDIRGGFEFDESALVHMLAQPEVDQAAWAKERIDIISETRCA